ncbi:MAG: carbohydrate kinase [Spirochaetaceae bacterium]|jgi:fructokinase|nr:carbohydrate kinase [Spirochaetaceae bacterium]
MIVCCGEALIDMVPLPGEKPSFLPSPGGSPYNSAIALGRLGIPVGFLGRLSKDFFGTMLIEKLRENNVHTDLIVRSGENSTLAFVKLEAGKEPSYIFYTEGSADRSLAPADVPAKLPADVRGLLFGSIAMTMEPAATTIESLILTYKDEKSPVISFDPNIRPFMIPHKETYRKRFEKWVKASTIVKISAEDLGFLYPELPWEDALQELSTLGPRLCVTTLGNDGALALLRQEDKQLLQVHAPGIPVSVTDTIGAGDTFHGGLLAWLERNGKMSRTQLAVITKSELQDALSFANKAASIVCTRPGADPPTFAEVLSLKQ